jgi:hypothetical protein
MARYKKRGNSHCIIYTYKDENDNDATIWETYQTEVLATQRKATIDYYQKTQDRDKVRELALQYRATQQEKKSVLDEKRAIAAMLDEPMEFPSTGNVTWRDFYPYGFQPTSSSKMRKVRHTTAITTVFKLISCPTSVIKL